jgi:8-hydroxy-5-deazaflavin:NADPH oxidoreductase
MNIGIVGIGNVGINLARLWVKNGHRVMLSFSRNESKLRDAAEELGSNANFGSPRDAVAFGDVVVLAVPWTAVTEAIKAAGPLSGKILFSTVNALNVDFSGLAVGTTTSAAEEIAKLAPGAKVIEALPPFAELLATGSTSVDGEQGTIFCCGEDSAAKTIVSRLLRESGVEVIDAGALSEARFIEPTMMLLVRLAYARGFGGQIAFRLLRNTAKATA